MEAMEAVEAPLRSDKQGPMCGKLELGATPPVVQRSVVRNRLQAAPQRVSAGQELQPQDDASEQAQSAARLASQEQAARKRAAREQAAQAAQEKESQLSLRGQPGKNSATAAGKSSATEKEFNWLSDEPVSDTAAKFAAAAKKEAVEKGTGNGSGKTVKTVQVTKEAKESNEVKETTETKVAGKVEKAIAPDSVKVAKKPHCSGVADFYAGRFHGLKTASGQIHDKAKYTAAHRTLPFGTKLKVVNRNTGKSCVVTVNDRGPFTPSRIIDLSEAAAKELGLITAKSRLVDCYIVENE